MRMYTYLANPACPLSLSLTVHLPITAPDTHTHTHTHTHSTTKITFLLALLYTLNETEVLHVTRPELLFATALAAIFIRAAGHLLNVDDMLSGPTHLLWAVLSALSSSPLKRTTKEESRRKHDKED